MTQASPICPFCETETNQRIDTSLAHVFRIFDCPNCHAEIKQNLIRKPESPEVTKKGAPINECPDCAFSDVHCFDCDDPVCDKHIRTFEQYQKYVSPDLAAELIKRYGNRIYCPLCFQNAFRRYTNDLQNGGGEDQAKPKFYNIPVIAGLVIVVLIIMLGLKSCDAPGSLSNASFTQEQSP